MHFVDIALFDACYVTFYGFLLLLSMFGNALF